MTTTIVAVNSAGINPYPTQVVGESRYQQNFEKIATNNYAPETGLDDDTFAAELILDDANPYDKNNAVLIKIEDLPVGYLDRADARRYRARLVALGLTGDVICVCSASIRGGFELDSGELANYGVRLDIDLNNFSLASKRISGNQPEKPATKTDAKESTISKVLRKLFPTPWHFIGLAIILFLIANYFTR